ncbi:hypothetical protein NKR23_g5256 [Pleurostoma richardsiae]|uniref:CFEM domain-containing protein n=1 Tax=Pleurostoma richardsiae TaxID=41990 RepID=A0AA38VJG6_9PEZI|nr:hypothetical protein NKR23_g5256 [Pleurostoma richardsiae]
MKNTLILLIAAAVSAQDLSGEPSCAVPCLSSAINAYCTPGTNMPCQCGPTQTAIANAAIPCLLDNCSFSDLFIAQSVGYAKCASWSATATPAPTTLAKMKW